MSFFEEASRVASAVLDLRQVPLAEMVPVTLDKASQRIPDSLTAPLPVATFSFAI